MWKKLLKLKKHFQNNSAREEKSIFFFFFFFLIELYMNEYNHRTQRRKFMIFTTFVGKKSHFSTNGR